MTPQDERAMHALALRLAKLTEGTGWSAYRYLAVAGLMEHLATYCAVCECEQHAQLQQQMQDGAR